MCGIAGVVDALGADRGALERSALAMLHRGPDDMNVWTKGPIGVAHTRLAIIDRSNGAQPIISDGGKYVVVFNGEIYNHHELRAGLLADGYPLRTECDSEVLPYLYDAHGPQMVELLQGMFAFAIIDVDRGELFLARDRLGKKPLYLASEPRGAAFASTLDALRPMLRHRPFIDPQAVAEYLVLQYVPANLSPWCGVEKIEPGTWVRWRQGSIERRRYWTPPTPSTRSGIDRARGTDEIRSRIRRAVAARLESEVPLGVFLSGGLDSSIVVAEMCALGVRPRTFSVGFQQAEFDERRFAEMVAQRFDTDHKTLVPEMDVEVLFRRFTQAYDEPFADSSALATLAVAEAASRDVTVVLTGDGGDELFGGYDRYRVHHLAERFEWLPPMVRRSVAALGVGSAKVLRSDRLASASRFLAHEAWEGYRDRMCHFDPLEARAVLSERVRDVVDTSSPHHRLDRLRAKGMSPAGRAWMPWVDAQTYLPDDLLTKMDRATMSVGVEARSPFLDSDLWAYVAGLPRSSLLNARQGKMILRDAYRGVLPAPILDRPKKGFGVPIADWMRGQLRTEVHDLLIDPAEPAGGLLNGSEVRKLVRAFLDGQDEGTARVWNLLALAGWCAARDAQARE